MWWPIILLLPACFALRDLEPRGVHRGAPRGTRDRVVEGWLNVRVDHFHAQNNDTFAMRYFYNDWMARSEEHMVIFVGGEWAISSYWVLDGLAYQLAEALGAPLFYTEHRFYGESRVGESTSVEQLRYLTVDQALGDLAQFIQHVRSEEFEFGRYRNAKVALVGCSYAGSMATWLRLGYPHLVTTALSDSGPLHAQEDFPEYLEMITKALREQGSEECVASVEEAVEELVELLSSPAGAAQVSSMFNTCSSIQATAALDVATFFWYGITEGFAYLVQYAIPGDIPAACAALTDSSVASAVQRLATWVASLRQEWDLGCIETRYETVVARHSNTSYGAPDAVMRLWTYQTCVEYGWYQSTSSTQQPFLSTVPLEYFHQMCRDFFSSDFDVARLRSGISRTNLLFAGLTHLPDRVVSVQGGHDPWAPMGPTEAHGTPLAQVFVVPEASHCRAIEPINWSEEFSELDMTKLAILNRLHYHMTGYYYAGAARLIAPAIVALGVVAALLLPINWSEEFSELEMTKLAVFNRLHYHMTGHYGWGIAGAARLLAPAIVALGVVAALLV